MIPKYFDAKKAVQDLNGENLSNQYNSKKSSFMLCDLKSPSNCQHIQCHVSSNSIQQKTWKSIYFGKWNMLLNTAAICMHRVESGK